MPMELSVRWSRVRWISTSLLAGLARFPLFSPGLFATRRQSISPFSLNGISCAPRRHAYAPTRTMAVLSPSSRPSSLRFSDAGVRWSQPAADTRSAREAIIRGQVPRHGSSFRFRAVMPAAQCCSLQESAKSKMSSRGGVGGTDPTADDECQRPKRSGWT